MTLQLAEENSSKTQKTNLLFFQVINLIGFVFVSFFFFCANSLICFFFLVFGFLCSCSSLVFLCTQLMICEARNRFCSFSRNRFSLYESVLFSYCFFWVCSFWIVLGTSVFLRSKLLDISYRVFIGYFLFFFARNGNFLINFPAKLFGIFFFFFHGTQSACLFV